MNRAAHLQPWFGDALQQCALRDLRLDSRSVCANDVFFALGAEKDVQAHIEQAAQRGAAAIVVDSARREKIISTLPVLSVENLQQQLGAMAHAFYAQPSQTCTVVGVTGTNGKTSCSHWLAQAWQQLSGNAAIIGTLGCGLIQDAARSETGMTTPDVLSNHRLLSELVQQGAKMVAMEVSSHALDQGRVNGVQFNTAIFTNLTRDHLDYHGDMEHYAAAKQKLFDVPSLQWAIINTDDVFGQQLLQHARKNQNTVLSYGIESSSSDLGVERFEVTGQGIAASIRTPWGKGALQSRFPGGYNLLNVLAVVATLCSHGMRLESVLQAVAQLQAVPGRTHVVSEQHDDVLVVVDYAHTPDALQKILQALRPQTQQTLWCVFGCGGNRDSGKRPQMAQIAEWLADQSIVTTDNPRDEKPAQIIADIVAGFSSASQQKKYCVVEDRAQAIAQAIAQAGSGDVILLAGKGHETYQEIAGVRSPFSDVEQAQRALLARRQQRERCSV